MTSVSNPVLDASRVFDYYYQTGGTFAQISDEEFDKQYVQAQSLMDDQRDKALQALWAYAYDKYWFLPLFGMDYVHGASPQVQWTPHSDGITLFAEMSLTS